MPIRVSLTGNMIHGAGDRRGTAFSGNKITAVYFDGGNFLATGNTISGVSVGFGGAAAPSKSTISSTVISNNVFENVGTAIDFTSWTLRGSLSSGNAINNCVTPFRAALILLPDGEVSGNVVADCANSSVPESAP